MTSPEPISFEERVKRDFLQTARPFRGEIWENARRFQLVGKAYEAMPADQNGYFDISSARHLIGPLRALRDPEVRIVFIIGATQVLKSVVGDIWMPFLIEHAPRNTLVLFEDDPKSKKYCDVRLMDTIKQHPFISMVLREDVDEHNATKTFIKLPSMTIMVAGLNDGNVSTLSWPYIWVSEAWQHKSDGLLRKAIKRADRFPDDCKILIESQPGMAGEDLHTEAKSAHHVPLTWACPFCDGRQTWDFSQLRPEEFQPRPVLRSEELIVEVPKPGTYAGMKFPPAERNVAGEVVSLAIDERARNAWWECYHCGSRIDDTKPTRKAIAESYEQDYRVTGPDGFKFSPKAVCFYLPKESALDNSFENSAKAYLTSKESQRAGNDVPLQDWYMAERAVFYDKKFSQPVIRASIGSYDPNAIIANEHSRGLVIDCQKHPELDTVGTWWFEAYVADSHGNSFQLERGFATAWEDLVGNIKSVQKRWKIPNHYVCVDGRKWTPEILKVAAAHRELAEGHIFGRKTAYWSTWKILLGDAPARHYRWPDGQYRVWSPPTPRPEYIINDKGQRERVIVMMYRWSNISVKDQLHSLRIGGEGQPKFMALQRSQLSAAMQLKEKGNLSYENQMNAEMRTEKGGKPYWDKIRTENHYWDTGCMRLVRMAMDGLASHIAAPAESAVAQSN